MATTVDTAKLKIRRGKNNDRRTITLDEGELGYTTDTKRTYIGDGNTLGGKAVGNINFNVGSRTSTTVANKAEIGDIVFDNNRLWALSAITATSTDSWMLISPRVDNTTIEYDANGMLQLIPGSITLGAVGNGLYLDGSNIPYVYLNTDTETISLLTFDGAKLTIGQLTDISHGALGYTTGVTQHHDNATASTPGFLSVADKTKLDNAPTYPIATVGDANLIMVGVNNASATQIPSNRISGNITASIAGTSDAVKRYLGQNATIIVQTLSAHELTTPYNFLNREDIPGTVYTTAIPTACISNQGAFPNFKIGGLATTVNTGNYQDKAFLLPSANGDTYSIYIQDSGAPTTVDTYIAAYPQLNVEVCDYDATGATLISNILNAINSITNEIGEHLFDAWEDGETPGDIYIQNLVRGYTTTYNAAFAEGSDVAYAIADVAVTYQNSNTYESKSGSGVSAADSSSGKVSASLFGWVTLNTTTQLLSSKGLLSVHTLDTFPTPGASLDGKYFLIYDTNYNRTCVWYDYTGGASIPGSVANTVYHRGMENHFVKVDISATSTADQLAAATVTALQTDEYFNSVYTVSYSTPTMTFISVNSGYTDGVINRKYTGLGASLVTTPNLEPGSPAMPALNSAFFTSYKVTTPSLSAIDQIVIPGRTQQTLIADDSSTINTASLLKFR